MVILWDLFKLALLIEAVTLALVLVACSGLIWYDI